MPLSRDAFAVATMCDCLSGLGRTLLMGNQMRLGVLIAFGVLSFARLPFPCYGAIDPIEAALEKAKAGDGFSQFRLGNSYDAGAGVAQDYAEAKRWYEIAADGNSEWAMFAQFYLARMYELGRGVPQSISQALRYYRLSAEKGFPDACYRLGVASEHGDGIPKDLSAANDWYAKAADVGMGAAMARLGINYTRGEGRKRSLLEAFVWLRLASKFLPGQARDDEAKALLASAKDVLREVQREITHQEEEVAVKRIDEWQEVYERNLELARTPK